MGAPDYKSTFTPPPQRNCFVGATGTVSGQRPAILQYRTAIELYSTPPAITVDQLTTPAYLFRAKQCSI